MAARLPLLAAALAAALLVPSGAASALPPGNDPVTAASPFAPYTAANGVPFDQQAMAELAEATADAGIGRCLGGESFERTVWFFVPAAAVATEVTVDASGRTLDPIDLALFVQPEVTTAPAGSVNHKVPNTCAGLGDGGASGAIEPGNAVTARVPPNHQVFVQVGRRGAAGTPDDERAVLSLRVAPIPTFTPVLGDRAEPLTPVARAKRPTEVPLANATITRDDAATPPCPSLGTVWRRLIPGNSVPRRVSVSGGDASTLAVFAGDLPAFGRPLDCVVRDGPGRMEMIVPARKGRTTWIRVGTDDLLANRATIRVGEAPEQRVVDGGSGGVDPTPGGPAGGLPAACDRPKLEQARIAGPRFSGPPGRYNAAGRCRSPSTSAAHGRAMPSCGSTARAASSTPRRCSGSSRRASGPSGSAGSAPSSAAATASSSRGSTGWGSA